MSSEDTVNLPRDSGGENVENKCKLQGEEAGARVKKVSASCLEQVDFPAGQVTFYSHLLAWQRLRQVFC